MSTLPVPLINSYRLKAFYQKKRLRKSGKSLNRPKSTLEEVATGMKKRAREKAMRGGK